MKFSKSQRLVILAILFAVLLVFPIYTEIYYPGLYYTGIVVLLAVAVIRILGEEKLEERFFKRWAQAREKGYGLNVLRASLSSFVYMVLFISAVQFVVNGRTPLEIVSKLPDGALIFILCFLPAISLIIGMVIWYENEKRYNRIYWRRGR